MITSFQADPKRSRSALSVFLCFTFSTPYPHLEISLVKEYEITPQRLRASGVGFLAPIASNVSEEGRAKNRRVELLPQ